MNSSSPTWTVTWQISPSSDLPLSFTTTTSSPSPSSSSPATTVPRLQSPPVSLPSQGIVIPSFTTASQVRVAVTFSLCALSLCCNAAVLWSASRDRRPRRSHVRILLVNLALSDLLTACVVMPLDAAWNITVGWRGGDAACRLLMFLKLVAMYSCAFVTVVISLDRHAAVTDPLGVSRAKRRNKTLLCAAWSLSALLALPQLFLFHVARAPSAESFTQCVTHGSFPRRWHEVCYLMFTFSCLYLLPLVVMLASYGHILLQISRRVKNVELREMRACNHGPSTLSRARARTLCMTALIVSSFIVCWTPYYLLGVWYCIRPAMASEDHIPEAVSHGLFLFGLLNACIDPVVYGFFSVPLGPGSACRRRCCCFRVVSTDRDAGSAAIHNHKHKGQRQNTVDSDPTSGHLAHLASWRSYLSSSVSSAFVDFVRGHWHSRRPHGDARAAARVPSPTTVYVLSQLCDPHATQG
uniref:Type II GnRH receptor n=1 Tax=Petromyzon marinus TaxID=7757 RepID=E5G0W2_PETMA|nr:gonadotropin releasing hormone receptor 2 [Petromyzon marinus]